MSEVEHWTEVWEKVDYVTRGYQGSIHLVKAKGDDTDDTLCVLKLLHKKNDPERRRRMYREVAALRTLDHPGIPRLVDSNAEKYDDLTFELYLVEEYAQGPPLSEIKVPLHVDSAILCILHVLDALEYCHQRGVVHRDLKPDNVVLRGGDSSDPVLVDFGLSFNWDEDSLERVTEAGQQLGNRFLSLPELRVSHSDKRDPRSDVASCCGLLFYLLTGIEPVALQDGEGNKPHQTRRARSRLSHIAPERLAGLNRVFDTGLEVHVDRRWQTAGALHDELSRVRDARPAEEESIDIGGKLDRAKETLRHAPDYSHRQEVRSLLTEAEQCIRSVHREIREELGPGFSSSQGGYHIDVSTYSLRNRLGFSHTLYPEKEFRPLYRVSISGTELVVVAEESGTQAELLREPFSGFDSWDVLRERVREYIADGVYSTFR